MQARSEASKVKTQKEIFFEGISLEDKSDAMKKVKTGAKSMGKDVQSSSSPLLKHRVANPAKYTLPTKFNGPVPQREVRTVLRTLIHSPRPTQINTLNNISLPNINIQTNLSIVGQKASVDAHALSLLPNDIPNLPTPAFPIEILGDGNCLARCGSIYAYGVSCYHLDIRLRVAMELIIHQEMYMDVDYLSRGLPQGQCLTPEQVAKFSGRQSDRDLTNAETLDTYRQDLHLVLKPKEFMAFWSVFALASVLKHPIFLVYPNKGMATVRKHTHRLILPREAGPSDQCYPIFLMWTSRRDDMPEEYWQPNHFAPILPTMYSEKVLDLR